MDAVVGCTGHRNWIDFRCHDHCLTAAVQGKVDQGEKWTGNCWIANYSNCWIGNCWMKEVASTVVESLCYSFQPAADHSRTWEVVLLDTHTRIR